jgi:hypothetical protein
VDVQAGNDPVHVRNVIVAEAIHVRLACLLFLLRGL